MAAQRRQIQERITNSLLWQSTLYHWLGHGWNPRNVIGLLDLYTHGVPPVCHYCTPAKPSQPTDVINQLLRELELP